MTTQTVKEVIMSDSGNRGIFAENLKRLMDEKGIS
jgi:hypothetical protein